ncbi:HAD family hydrolase [Amycolatopsis rubida]|uniref:FMN phosphatase YigB, HAD superfamily n=1 Tax=Amycolatopsis rubida TaxID=112413 RepID=A0A1I5E2V0_9PSEU|nr:HAD family hydrolase [Amycolatopsis rubida]SFO05849.1 FMN phosphatase YigB, HAD superfamily [Amycolatopsis rubida]
MLITSGVGGTLGSFHGPGTADVLREIALAPDDAAEIDRNILHVVPELTDEVAELVRERLLISISDWPLIWPTGGFTAFPGTLTALERVAVLAPVVALSNVSCISGPARMGDLRDQCGQFLAGVCTSYQLQARKPQPRCWAAVAAEHRIPVGDIVHLGDRVLEDVRGSLAAGCRAAVLVDTRNVDVPADIRDDPRVTVVRDLADAADRLAELAAASAPWRCSL